VTPHTAAATRIDNSTIFPKIGFLRKILGGALKKYLDTDTPNVIKTISYGSNHLCGRWKIHKNTNNIRRYGEIW
jgi:hypothetical protein